MGLLGHPVLWTPEEAIAAITRSIWTTNPSLQRDAVWPWTKHDVLLGDNTRILMALSDRHSANVLSRWSGRRNLYRFSISQSCGRNIHKCTALVTRQMRSVAVLWMTVRDSLAQAMRCATLEVVRLQLTAMIVDISPKVYQVSWHEDDSNVASLSVCPADLCIQTIGEWSRERAETDGEGSAADPRNRASTQKDPCFGTTRGFGCAGDRANRRL